MDEHKALAVKLFNETWDLLDNLERSKDDDSMMLHKAHASAYHWYQVGTALEFQRAEWLIARVCSTLSLNESALYHATRCLEITLTHAIDDFDLVFAYEALARAHSAKSLELATHFLKLGYESLDQVKDTHDKAYAKRELDNIKVRLKG